MKGNKKQRQRMVETDDSNVICAKVDKPTSVIGKLSTQHKQSNPFKPRVYQGKG